MASWGFKAYWLNQLGTLRLEPIINRLESQYGFAGYNYRISWRATLEGVKICTPDGEEDAVAVTSYWGTPSQAVNRLWTKVTQKGRTKPKLRRWLEKEGQENFVYKWTWGDALRPRRKRFQVFLTGRGEEKAFDRVPWDRTNHPKGITFPSLETIRKSGIPKNSANYPGIEYRVEDMDTGRTVAIWQAGKCEEFPENLKPDRGMGWEPYARSEIATKK